MECFQVFAGLLNYRCFPNNRLLITVTKESEKQNNVSAKNVISFTCQLAYCG